MWNEDQVHEVVRIDRTDLEGEYTRVAADMATAVRYYAGAVENHELAKAQRDSVIAVVRDELRANLEALNGKVPPESRLAVECEADASVQSARVEVAKALGARTYLKGLVESIATKRDMLVSLGATVRQERAASGLAP